MKIRGYTLDQTTFKKRQDEKTCGCYVIGLKQGKSDINIILHSSAHALVDEEDSFIASEFELYFIMMRLL